MGQMYSAVFSGVAVTAQQDLFEIVAPSGGPVLIHQLILSQSTEVGDAQEEGLSILIRRGATTTGSGGSTYTAIALDSRPGLAAGSTVKINNTTKASAGTIVTVHSENWNVRGPFPVLPTPELRLVVAPAQRMTVELATTPADSITMSGTLYFEEL